MADNSTLENLKLLASQGNDFDASYMNAPPQKKTEVKFNKKSKDEDDSHKSFMKATEAMFKKASDRGDFDTLISYIEDEDDDIELRDSVISMGRKYARDYSMNGEENEVSKAFAPQESKLKDLYTLLSKEAMKLEEDINNLRDQPRSRNYGKISDMVEVKGTLINNQLSVIKELNAMTKAKFDIRNKMKENNNANGDSAYASEAVIQRLFGLGHDTMLSSVGGRSASSGAIYENDEDESESRFEDTEAYNNIINHDMTTDTDGDKFLKYEDTVINYVLTEYDDGTRIITAEDIDGNIIDDYPTPKDVDELRFDINQKTGVATDQLQRKYIYRTA